MQELEAISPIDGRYRKKVESLKTYFSEAALIQYRTRVEIEYLIALSETKGLNLRALTQAEKTQLINIYKNFTLADAEMVKDKEAITNHDVKSVEYFLKEKLTGTSLEDIVEWIHFALTSEDINNLAYALMLSEAIHNEIIPAMQNLVSIIDGFADANKSVSMLARTHGQSASPTTFGKEMKVFSARLTRQLEQLQSYKILAKLNGATGNYNAHMIAFPKINWTKFTCKFIDKLNQDLTIKLETNLLTTQIESHDTYAELFDIISRFNTILISFNQDIWRYISDNWVSQKPKAGEVGSSTMPHKVNPIDFENSEGNLGLANALFGFFKSKLPISRLQRDLTDSTVVRNMGVALAYSLIAYQSAIKGLSKVSVNETKIKEALYDHPEVIAEAIQTVMRREGKAVPYEQLKELTRGKKITLDDFQKFINELDVNKEVKAELHAISPENYIGIAVQLVSE